jgi:anthranilate synthase component 2
MNVLLIDNRDSFTHNLADAFRVAGAKVAVVRNSIGAPEAMARAEGMILLSPGPGAPADAGCCVELVRLAAARVPLVGVCLGHQAIAEARGGRVARAPSPCHGKTSVLAHAGGGAFAGMPSPVNVGRYHSLCTPVDTLPEGVAVDAVLDGMAMAIRDEEAGQLGVQFHPESILTPQGDRMIANMLGWARDWLAARERRAA